MSKVIYPTGTSGKIYRRRQRVLNLLTTGDRTIQKLAKDIGVSKSTIKTDIYALDSERKVRLTGNLVCLC